MHLHLPWIHPPNVWYAFNAGSFKIFVNLHKRSSAYWECQTASASAWNPLPACNKEEQEEELL